MDVCRDGRKVSRHLRVNEWYYGGLRGEIRMILKGRRGGALEQKIAGAELRGGKVKKRGVPLSGAQISCARTSRNPWGEEKRSGPQRKKTETHAT